MYVSVSESKFNIPTDIETTSLSCAFHFKYLEFFHILTCSKFNKECLIFEIFLEKAIGLDWSFLKYMNIINTIY